MNFGSYCKTVVLLASILGLLIFPYLCCGPGNPSRTLGLLRPDDPKHWAKLDPAYSACALGHTESPINIAHAQLADLPRAEAEYEPTPLNIIDNGHTIQVNPAPGSAPGGRRQKPTP